MHLASAVADGTLLRVKVVPGASRSAVAGPYGDEIRIQVAAAAEKGKANRALVAFLAERLGLRPAALEIVKGASNPHKTVRVTGMAPGDVVARLLP
jgi:uncharacterized protein (TIGR00251 family)